MADRNALIERLYRRFKGVPNFTLEDAEALIDEASEAHESSASDSLILLYAQSQGAWDVALSVAHYFRFKVGEDEVDQSMVASIYRALAKDLQSAYESEKGCYYGNKFRLKVRINC